MTFPLCTSAAGVLTAVEAGTQGVAVGQCCQSGFALLAKLAQSKQSIDSFQAKTNQTKNTPKNTSRRTSLTELLNVTRR